MIPARSLEIPAYCEQCGNSYPWTTERLDAAQEFARELDGLSDSERDLLAKSLADIVSDTSRTPLAVTRIKKLVAKAAKPVGEAFYKLAIDLASETARKSLTGQ